jgi:hypothetical protein
MFIRRVQMRLTDEERERVVAWLFDSEVTFLVQTIMDLLPYEDAKRLADRLNEESANDSE